MTEYGKTVHACARAICSSAAKTDSGARGVRMQSSYFGVNGGRHLCVHVYDIHADCSCIKIQRHRLL